MISTGADWFVMMGMRLTATGNALHWQEKIEGIGRARFYSGNKPNNIISKDKNTDIKSSFDSYRKTFKKFQN